MTILITQTLYPDGFPYGHRAIHRRGFWGVALKRPLNFFDNYIFRYFFLFLFFRCFVFRFLNIEKIIDASKYFPMSRLIEIGKAVRVWSLCHVKIRDKGKCDEIDLKSIFNGIPIDPPGDGWVRFNFRLGKKTFWEVKYSISSILTWQSMTSFSQFLTVVYGLSSLRLINLNYQLLPSNGTLSWLHTFSRFYTKMWADSNNKQGDSFHYFLSAVPHSMVILNPRKTTKRHT